MKPSDSSSRRMAGSATMADSASYRRWITAGGVPAGASRPCHWSSS
ncbi:Uncharacterised protein [Bordetella pertussis]|nr:Uncharacterised protein [Bordetella pertussis]